MHARPRRQWGRAGAVALVLVASIAGCKSTSKGAPGEAGPEPARDGGPAGASRIACGAATCRAGEEVCCDRLASARCAPAAPITRPIDPDYSFAPAGLFDRCAVTGERSTHAQCDDSEDCPAGETCCAVAVPRGALVCTKSPHMCIDREPCRPGTCRTSGTTCGKDGRCSPVVPEVECHARRCAGKTPVCCMMLIGEDACVDDETPCDKPAMFRYECDEPSDCGPGLMCCFGGGTHDHPVRGAFCALSCDSSGSVACVNDADCRRPEVPQFHAPSIPGWRCLPMNLPPRLKTCEPISAPPAPPPSARHR